MPPEEGILFVPTVASRSTWYTYCQQFARLHRVKAKTDLHLCFMGKWHQNTSDF